MNGMATALQAFRRRSTGESWNPGDPVFAPEDKLREWAEEGLVRIEETRLFSNGKPTFATTFDQAHIRVYAWCLANLRFGSALPAPLDPFRVAADCRLTVPEARSALGKLVADGDLQVERERRTGKEVYFLAPIRIEEEAGRDDARREVLS